MFFYIGKDCGPYTPGDGLTCGGNSSKYPTSKACLCKSGYERLNNDDAFSVKCGTDGQWSSPNDGLPSHCTSK